MKDGKALIDVLFDSEGPCESLGSEIGKMVDEKQKVYGDSYSRSGEIMRILYPNGIPVEQYDDALAVIRVIDKLFRIATDKDALGESPWRDIAGYGILGSRKGTYGWTKPKVQKGDY